MRQPLLQIGGGADLKLSLFRLHFFGRKSNDKADSASNHKNLNKGKKPVRSSDVQPPHYVRYVLFEKQLRTAVQTEHNEHSKEFLHSCCE